MITRWVLKRPEAGHFCTETTIKGRPRLRGAAEGGERSRRITRFEPRK